MILDDVSDRAASGYASDTADVQVNQVGRIGSLLDDFTSDVRSGLLSLEPTEVKIWLAKFQNVIAQIVESNAILQSRAQVSAMAFQSFGEFPPSQQIAAKIADRLGSQEGGLGWAINEVAKRLNETYLALNQSLTETVIKDQDGGTNVANAGGGG